MDEQRSDSTATATIRTSRFDVFLSYNSRDKPSVERIAEKLKRAGLEPWLDSWCLTPGGNWQEELAEGLRASAACAVFVGPNDLGDWENQELAAALDRAAKEPTFRVFLVLLPGLPEPFDPTTLSPFVSTRTWVDLRPGIGDGRELQSLVNAVKGVPLGPEVPIEPREDVAPYRGLQKFDEEDAEFFFGRDGDVQRLLEKLKTTRFLAVLGPSGSGKSSLVRAGLLPALRRGAPPVSKEGLIAVLTPGSHPLTALAVQLLRLQPADGMQKTLDGLRDDPRTLHLAGALALADRPAREQIVWVIDQFEEVFTLCRDEDERAEFFANLLYASSIPGGHATVVLTLRADFYHKCAAHPELSQRIAAQQFLVSPIDGDGLRQVIEEPARRVGLVFEEGLVATILEDVHNQPGALPLLEHALLELWERRRGEMLTLEGYRESGGVAGAIAKRADEIYSGFTPEEQAIARRTLLRLTQPGESTEDTRRRATLGELVPRAGEEEAVEGVVRALVDARMLTASADELTNGRWIDVSHEALIRGWPRLRGWLDEDRAGLLVHRRLTEAAKEWERHDRDDSALYRGARLAEAIEWRSGNEGALNELEREFLAASADLQRREHAASRRRLRLTVGGLLVALVLIAGGALYALRESRNATHQRDIAFSRELAASANAQLSADPELSTLLAIEALRHARTDQAEDALRLAVRELHRYTALGGQAEVLSAAFSPDGRLVLTASADGTARVLEAETGEETFVFRGHEDRVNSAVFSSDGRLVVTASADGTARTWSPWTGDEVTVFRRHEGPVSSAAFSRDGNLVVTASRDGTARVWKATTGEELVVFRRHTREVNSAAFSPVGGLVVTTSPDRTARVWDAATGEEAVVFREHRDPVLDAAFSPNGRLIVTASADGTARMWKAATGEEETVFLGHEAAIESAAFSNDSALLVTASEDRTARVWATETGEEVAVLRGHTDLVKGAALGVGGRLVVTASRDGTARVWELRNQATVVLRGHAEELESAAFSPDGRSVVTASTDSSVRIWNTATGDELLKWTAHKGDVKGAAFSPDSRYIVTGGGDKLARIWNAATGEPLLELSGHRDEVKSAAFSPDGRLVVTGSADKSARIWNATTGKTVLVLKGHDDEVEAASFSSDGRFVLTGSEDTSARIWDATTGKTVTELKGHKDQVEAAAFSGNARLVVTASSDDDAHVWDAATGRILRTLTGHEGDVEAADISRDGRFAVTGSDDRTVRVWETATGKELVVFRGHAGELQNVAFSTDGRFVVTASEDGEARIYRCELCVPIDRLPELAREAVTRELTPQERAIYLHE
jgi:WD40 repeat protein/energy-coupling factor transporter ATP-binding protein EcfA2